MELQPSTLPPNAARVDQTGAHAWRLSIPAGASGSYRLAQLDDYRRLPRRAFFWQPPLRFSLVARVSTYDLPGTWGFGLWNDPFSASLGLGGVSRRLPVPPNCAWFFHASPANYLSLRNDLPASGFLAATFRAAPLPPVLLAFGLPLLPGLAWKPAARLIRRCARRFIRQDAARLDLDVTAWKHYTIEWLAQEVTFAVDGHTVLETTCSPRGRLGAVLWIDNQYAAFTPRGELRFGTQPNPAAWLEIAMPQIEPL